MSRFVLRFVFVVAALVPPSRAFATPILITFDTLSELDAVTNQFPGILFSGATVFTAGSNLNEAEAPPHSGDNVVVDDGGPIDIMFASPVSNVGGYFTYTMPLFFEAFNAGNVSLGSFSSAYLNNLLVSGDPSSSPNEFLQFGFGGISRVTITGDPSGGSFLLDDFGYETSDLSASPVPEPGTMGLVLLGGAALLRKLIRNRRVTVDK